MSTSTSEMVCLVDGKQCDSLPLNDLGFLRGYAVFEYIRTYGNRPFHLKDHIERLKRSANEVGLKVPRGIEDSVSKAIARGGFDETSVKVIVTGGPSDDQFSYSGNSSLIVLAYPFKRYPERLYREGAKLVSVVFERPYAKCKTLFYLPAIRAMQLAQEYGADDALFVTPSGEILETGTANFFAIVGGEVVTPRDNVLGGITRKCVVSLTDATVRSVHIDEIKEFEGAFVTASNKEIMPVTEIDGLKIPFSEGVLKVMRKYQTYVKKFF